MYGGITAGITVGEGVGLLLASIQCTCMPMKIAVVTVTVYTMPYNPTKSQSQIELLNFHNY